MYRKIKSYTYIIKYKIFYIIFEIIFEIIKLYRYRKFYKLEYINRKFENSAKYN